MAIVHFAPPATQSLLSRLGEACPDLVEHGLGVATLSLRIARLLGVGGSRLDALHCAALLHDIGKREVPRAILDKPGRLDDDEWELIERHPAEGARILHEAGLEDEARIVLHHHERFDGFGYPCGAAGADIPLESRILAVADAFDAMTHDRPYRPAMTEVAAIAELMVTRGRQCDPQCVDALRAVMLRTVA